MIDYTPPPIPYLDLIYLNKPINFMKSLFNANTFNDLSKTEKRKILTLNDSI